VLSSPATSRRGGRRSGRDRILTEARKLFGSKGYSDVSMRDVAGAAGVTKAALYYHFANKQDLFTTVSLLQIERILGALEEAAGDGGSLEERLARLVRVGQERLEVDVYRPHFQAHEHLDTAHHLQLHAAMDRLQEPVIRCFEEAGPPHAALSPEAAATMLGGLLASLILFADEPGREDPLPRDKRERANLAVRLFIHGYEWVARGQAGEEPSPSVATSPSGAAPDGPSSSSASSR
jgi:AcrR family transcriptional regulator